METELPKKKRKPKTKRKDSTAEEILETLNKQWASNEDIAIIGGVGKNKSSEDRRKIEEIIKDKYGKDCRLPKAKVPMEEVVKFYNINISYLKKVAQINKK